jgi:hypothetical protein
MDVKLPVAPEVWQQIPPPAQSALLEALEQAQRRCQSLEEQLHHLQSRVEQPGVSTPSHPLELPGPTPAARDTKLSRRHHRSHHRSPEEKRRARRREKFLEAAKRHLFWPLLVAAVVLALWVVLQMIGPGKAPPVPRG